MRKNKRMLRVFALGFSMTLIAAACGDDDDDDASSDTTTETTAAAATTAAPATTAGGADTTAAAGGDCVDADTDDASEGAGAAAFIGHLKCAAENPLEAEGDPILIGFQNPEGDPNGSFPEYSDLAQAAVEYINNELGGVGADIANGVPGRPIQLEVCKMAINPADSQKCANELAGKEPLAVVSSLNFFGNHFPIYQSAGIPVIVGTPITVGDFTAPDVYSIGGGGGCLGVHTGMVFAATQEIKGKRVGVPWADTPPGVVCYYDLESKPLDVLQGAVEGTSELAGSIPDLEHIGVPIKPATPDLTPQVTQLLDFEPDVILYSAQGADCWNFVAALGRSGWTPDTIPLVLSGACIDFVQMETLGDLTKGIYFVGTSNILDTDGQENPRLKFEGLTLKEKAAEYGADEANITKGFGVQGWAVMMTIWEQLNAVAAAGEITGGALREQFAGTTENHIYGSVPFGCAGAPEPYVAVCNSVVTLTQWDGANLKTVVDRFSGIELVPGTELRPGR